MDKLFQKFVNNSLKKKEYKKLMEYIDDPASQSDVEKMMDNFWKKLDGTGRFFGKNKDSDSEILYRKIVDKIENTDERPKKPSPVKIIRFANLYKIAAMLVIAASLLYGYQNWPFDTNQVSSLSPGEDITLTLDDGRVKVISEKNQSKIISAQGILIGTQKGNQLNYQNTEISEELVYNALTVPYGKRLDLTLSDGTQVKLNAGSSIKYPVRFLKGEDRKVFLNGEAFFDVAKDKAHPFIVNAKDINVQVLGTQFNMSYYPEDDDISTVLVEGSVKLYASDSENTKKKTTLLAPGHIAAWNKATHKMSIKKVNTQTYTAWKDGTLLFKNASFKNIRMKLERHFNIPIENSYAFLENQIYTASFTDESLGEIMEAFKEDTPFEFEYELSNNKIIITKQTTNKSKEPSQ